MFSTSQVTAWKMPWLRKNITQWVYECARSGRKAPETDYAVDKMVNDGNATSTKEVTPDLSANTTSSSTAPVNTKASSNDAEIVKEVGKTLDFPPMPRPPSVVDHIRRKLERKMKAQLEINKATPFKDKVLRMMDTPSKFLSSNADVSFQLDEVFSLLKTPMHEQERIKASMKSDQETPLSECVGRFLEEALKNVPDVDEDLAMNLEKVFESVEFDDEEENVQANKTNPVVEENKNGEDAVTNEDKPLKGVVLYVCKKLTKQRIETSDLVAELGGEFRWTYDAACTHFVFQGKANDTNREFRGARSEGKIIVSPHWLLACKEANKRLDEEGFPHVYNPNKSIQMVPTASQTKSKRKTRNMSQPTVSKRATRSSARTSSTESEDVQKDSDKEEENDIKASQEARESLKKTLETIMSSTSKPSKSTFSRLSSSRNGSSSPLLPPPMKVPQPSHKMTSDSEKPDSSQDVRVMWDDPIGREEMEKIMREQEKKNKNPISTSDLNCEKNPISSDDVSTKKPDVSRSLPVQPDIIPSGSAKDDHADGERLSQIIREGRTPSFLISSVTVEQKTEYAAIIEQLGGLYLDRDCFVVGCTHLIVKKPARNEKYLASLASGKFVLHTSYIEACREAGVFVKEDGHEYGNPSTSWRPSNDAEAALSAAAYRWRRSLNKNRRNNERVGAFADWKILLFVSQRHTPGFVRLLESGLGQVVGRSIPYDGDVSELTHAIIDPNRVKEVSSEQIEFLHNAGVHCCVPEYIADFLMKDPLPNVQDSYLPIIKQIIESEDVKPSKRRKIN